MSANNAVLLLKPNAANAKCAAMVEASLASAGFSVTSKGVVEAVQIDTKGMIDDHYGSV